MKRSLYIAIAILILSGCNKEEGWDCLKSYGDEITERRNLGKFDKVFVSDKINLDYRFSDSCYVEVSFGENIVHHIQTQVEGSSIYISNEATCNWVRSLKKIPLVTIYAPTLHYLYNTSSATLTMRDTLVSNDFLYEQRGSNGSAFLLVNTDSTTVLAHTGYTDIKVSGRTEFASLYNASVGKFDASLLNSNITLVNNSSLQDLPCVAEIYLFGEINLSGNILYSGHPELIDTNIYGSGRVMPR